MAIEVAIRSIKPNSLKTQSVIALLKDGQTVKQVEKVMPLGADAVAVIQADAAGLFETGTPLPVAAWYAAQEKPRRDYYYTVILNAYQTVVSGGDIDMARSAAFLAIQQDAQKLAEFNTLRQAVGLSGTLDTMEQKRDDLLWMGVFAIIGILSGSGS